MPVFPNSFFAPQRLGLLVLFWCAGLLRVLGQAPGPGVTAPGPAVVQVGVLPDRGYSWSRVRADTTLAFAPTDSLRPAQSRQYWLRVQVRNPSRYATEAQLLVRPGLDNTLYYFHEDARRWLMQRAGLAVGTDNQRVKGQLRLPLPGGATTTCYVQVRLDARAALPAAIRLQVRAEDAAAARQHYLLFRIAWAVSVTVLVLLVLTSGFAYLRFRDPAILYYICAQAGGLLYITAYRSLFNQVFPTAPFSLRVLPSGIGYQYNLNSVLMHLSVVLLLVGLVQMTRAYLRTSAHLPRLDAWLRYALVGYVGFAAVVALVNLSGFHLNSYTILYDNVLVLGVVGLLLATSVVAYRRRLPSARAYLLATVLPLLFMLGMAGYHVFVSLDNDGALLLPDLAVVSHALCFSAALGSRLYRLQQTLLANEQAANLLALDIRQKQLRHQELQLDHKHIQAALRALEQQQQVQERATRQLSADLREHQATNQELQQQLEANQRELASTSLYVEQKNALLAELKQQIGQLGSPGPGQPRELAGIKLLLQSNLHLDEDWQRFKLHFEQVHPRFFEELQARYPTLTRHELRLCGYFHLNLATKEIAGLLNIDPASVRRAKTRLYKKMAAADLAAGRTPTTEAEE